MRARNLSLAKHVPWLAINAVSEQKRDRYEIIIPITWSEIWAGLDVPEYLNQHGSCHEQTGRVDSSE
jgi:hypothetical protein